MGEGPAPVASAQSPAPPSKLSCHSDYVDPETAKKMQEEKAGMEVIVQVDVRPALGIGKDAERLI